jgi:bacillithiol system protein YtxJ
MKWNALEKPDQIKDIQTASDPHPILIFKHSTRCSISAAALNRLERKWDEKTAGNLQCYLLDLIQNRETSHAVAELFKVTHQSPQILLIHKGQAVHDASHFDIDFQEIKQHLNQSEASA